MDNRVSTRRIKTREVVNKEVDAHPVNYTTAYLRRLIAERPYIRAALYNHGGSIITHGVSLDLEGQDVYTSQIGNDFHLDLVEAEEIILTDMSKQQRDTLIDWADGINEKMAADLMRLKTRVLHMRRKRAVDRLQERMEDGQLGGTGRSTPEEVRESGRDEPTKDGDSR